MTTLSQTQTGVAAQSLPASHAVGRIMPGARLGTWTRVAIAWRAVINHLAPIGYEDETGFHYGEMPASNTSASRADSAAGKNG